MICLIVYVVKGDHDHMLVLETPVLMHLLKHPYMVFISDQSYFNKNKDIFQSVCVINFKDFIIVRTLLIKIFYFLSTVTKNIMEKNLRELLDAHLMSFNN
jgi:hypothetical protein